MQHKLQTYIDHSRPPLTGAAFAHRALVTIAGSVFIAVSAHIQVPMWPVPMTMQSFAVVLVALAFGSRLALATVALYLLEGATGAPVFAGGGGALYLAGPTAGYLYSYLAVAVVGGLAAKQAARGRMLPCAAAAMAATVVIYAGGAAWLSLYVGFEKAIAVGVVPFILGDTLKMALAVLVLPGARAVIARMS